MVVPKLPRVVWLLVPLCLISSNMLLAGDLQIKPGIVVDMYGYQIKQAQSSEWDEGAALAATPNIAFLFDSKYLVSVLDWKQKNVFYDDAQRSDKTLDYIDFNSRLSAWDDRVALSLNAGEGYRLRNTQRGVFADEITGFSQLSKTRYMGTSLALSTARHRATQGAVNFTARKINSELPVINDDDPQFNEATFDNALYEMNFALGTAQRTVGVFWQISGRYAENVRENAIDLTSENIEAVLALPLLEQWAWVSKARYESNELYANADNEFGSVGTGLEYRIGKASYINLTYNVFRRDQLLLEDGDYWALDMLLAPTRRSSIKVSLDQRYYGRSVEVSGRYRLRHVSAQLTYNERLRVMNGLETEVNNLGVLVCPGGSSAAADCFLPPSANYQLLPGEYLQNVYANEIEFNESVVLRKSGLFNLVYDKNRLVYGLSLSRSEDEYVETNRFNITDNVTVFGKWRLSPTMQLSTEYSWYELQFSTEQRTDRSIRIKAGISFEINSRSDISLNAQRVSRDSNLQEFDLEENRAWVTYAYNF
ncbi:hypothetical protein ORJ04_01800 [Rheinheimera baltica]|uniref:TIGR03016 family PEP-CTERM system-associated outer membrane protein n=1 Tax=Rheinheimera baltica TaxID=67576 RepID=A0ABT9HU92_9GAMM|nr:hypothetical protein [Rheinheimera baltica]MDP5134681.1 hypothetical protein [Rheinheimera baltica]